MIANPMLLLALLIGALTLYGGSYYAGTIHATNACKAEKLGAVERAIEQANSIATEDAAMATYHEAKREIRSHFAKQLDKEIEKNVAANPGYFKCGLDADGLRKWNAANAGDSVESSGKRDAGLPGLAAGRRWQLGNAIQKPQGNDRSVLRVPGPESGKSGGD